MAKIIHPTKENTKEKALLIAAYTGSLQKQICVEHLEELALLAETYGIHPLEQVACPLRKIDASTYFGKGKVTELVDRAKELGVNVIIVDEEIAPSQQRNLEQLFGMTVLDRTELILGVFAQRAQTKEARLQIELAQVKYQLPRLKRLWTHLSRQRGTAGGGGAYLKGEGEKQIELDRRMLEKRIDQLKAEIEEVRAYRQTQRQGRKRQGVPTFALVGYTNAGKSTLLNALTEAGVFVEDKLFATLDTTTRKYTLGNNQEVLITDTVGFIRKLPHLLVAAFKSTLEEALHSDFLIHVVDVSHPMAEEQAETTFEVLKELDAGSKPIITVLNKVDKEGAHDRTIRLRLKYPKCIAVSALHRTGFHELEEAMEKEIRAQRTILNLRIPQSEYGAVSEVIRQGSIIQQEYVEDEVLMRAEIPKLLGQRLSKYVVE